MTLYYSKSNRGFFDSDIHSDIPTDSIRVTEEERDYCLNEEAKGRFISVQKGKVVVIDTDPKEYSDKELLSFIRMRRNRLLDESDYTQTPDYPISDEKRQEWSVYRQQLRDITETYKDDIKNVVWPTKPE